MLKVWVRVRVRVNLKLKLKLKKSVLFGYHNINRVTHQRIFSKGLQSNYLIPNMQTVDVYQSINQNVFV